MGELICQKQRNDPAPGAGSSGRTTPGFPSAARCSWRRSASAVGHPRVPRTSPDPGLSNLDGTNGFRLNGVAPGDDSGFAVSGVGDVNGDGLADLLIGALGAGPNGAGSGASYVVFGRDTAQNAFPASLVLSGLDGTNGFRLTGVAADDRSGAAVSGAGDVNGDGLADLLIGALGAGPNGAGSGASLSLIHI